jgi:hypothetical protein
MEKFPNNEYFITYSNSFYFENELLVFRKKELFNISNIPIHIPFNKKTNCWIVKRKQLSFSKAKELCKNNEVKVDVSCLQWYVQINLDYVFNL